MNANQQCENPAFRQVAKGLIDLHRLGEAGNESPEAEAIRDALDAPFDLLSSEEYERARWLSEDLYSISEPSEPPLAEMLKEMYTVAKQTLQEVISARQVHDLDRALILLRSCKDYISPALLSYLRGTIWLDAGLSDVAAEFFKHACEGKTALGTEIVQANGSLVLT